MALVGAKPMGVICEVIFLLHKTLSFEAVVWVENLDIAPESNRFFWCQKLDFWLQKSSKCNQASQKGGSSFTILNNEVAWKIHQENKKNICLKIFA